MKSLVILISGRGSNMQALLEAEFEMDRITVISSNPNAEGLAIAKKYGIETIILDHRTFPDRESFDATLAERIDACQPKLIALAGFMRILSDRFVHRFQGRLMNIHPSLLPAFPGLRTHARALQEGIKIHGCTVHFVTPQLDHGPIVIQAAIPVLSGDTEEILATRVLQQEHRIYPQAVRWFMEDRIKLGENHVEVMDSRVNETALYSPELPE
ncbi:formyltetrahydrofolate-dependent phosphoribosylglycinamide formyltransferase [Nitrosomonas sp. Nm84]|uniref:phosphoribosylglycinamide formyltransferase n=1 Tax=Nitrosomonas sp. Nm84 TaxID=200124 RepID=UPI000D75145C|nr:phosphoribosylglycinamide formyltransferase [Nitrosomonas sp. Nm84]PXW90745.1 formyltetrahydrofolate-dependent phosphoribosylglycinamide formyltransferase [Nitrosomonas sp. Nm84]